MEELDNSLNEKSDDVLVIAVKLVPNTMSTTHYDDNGVHDAIH